MEGWLTELLSMGADGAIIAIGIYLWRMNTRLVVVETRLLHVLDRLDQKGG